MWRVPKIAGKDAVMRHWKTTKTNERGVAETRAGISGLQSCLRGCLPLECYPTSLLNAYLLDGIHLAFEAAQLSGSRAVAFDEEKGWPE
jgi:hypothetical protein